MLPPKAIDATASKGPHGARPNRTAPTSKRFASRMSTVLLGNESWDFFDGIPKHYSLRTRVRMKMQLSTAGFAWEICQTLFAIVASTLYVVQTYQPDFDTDAFDLSALIVFSIDYTLNFYAAESRWWFTISFMSMMDIVTIIPSLIDRVAPKRGSGLNVGNSFPFLRFIRVLRLLRLTRLIRAAGSRSSSAVQKQIHTIVLLITCIVFISAGVFHAVESSNRLPGDPVITYGDSLYYLVVTMSTVGYGDIAPLTTYGKVAAAAMIIISFTIIPRELTRLTQLMSLQSQFRRFYHPSVGNPHILVVGHILDARVLLDFFKELYHPDRQTTDDPKVGSLSEPLTDSPCVLMGPDEPNEAIVNLLDHPLLQGRVTYIKGSVMSEEDLCRVGADAARACFVLVPKSRENPQKTDADTVLRLLAIRNYNADLEIFTQMVSSGYSDYISEIDADHVLCINEIKLSLIAKSCLCPGLVTLVSNLFRSSAISSSATNAGGWHQEYAQGVAMEVYAARVPPIFYGLSFAQSCEVLYQCFNGEVIMMGVFDPAPNETLGQRQHSIAPTTATPSGNPLPNLKIQAVQPKYQVPSPLDGSAKSSQMLINPGHDVCMREGQIVYMLCESKQLTRMTTITKRLESWLSDGNKLPVPITSRINQVQQEQPPSPIDPDAISTPLVVSSASRPRTESEVLVEEAIHPLSGRPIENHIIVVTDLDHSSMQTFVKLLRLSHHVPGHAEYHKILFLSWANPTKVADACRVLQAYDDVFLMMAQKSNSKAEFLRANILRAARCVLLSDKSSITQLDGEAVDSQTIFHYLAILSIQSELGVDTTTGLMPIVELTMPRTMKILDSALTKRTLRSLIHRQKINAFIRRNSVDKAGGHGRPWTKKLVPHLVRQGTGDFSSLRSSIMLRKSMQMRHLSLRQQDSTTNRSASFDATGTALLPFFAAGYGFSDDVFDNMLCQSYFTPGLVRFIYALIFTENGRPHSRSRSTLDALIASEALYNVGVEDLGIDDDDDEDDDFDDDEVTDDTQRIVVASSIVQVPVPIEFVASTFGELFLHFLATEQAVVIALYRGRGTPFSLPYVATGPSLDTVLLKDDLVFVLAQPTAQQHLIPSLKSQNCEP